MKRLLILVATLAALIFAGCGSHSSSAPVRTVHGHACTPHSYFMQCALSPAASRPTLVAPTAILGNGIDFAWGGPSAATMRANGWTFAASYLSFEASKNWRPAQVAEYARAGIARVYVWEYGQYETLGGCNTGVTDARAAISQAHVRVIYFAVDYELQPSQVGTVQSYFRCVDGVLGESHVGVYGSAYTVNEIAGVGLARYGWGTLAWSGSYVSPHSQLYQWQNGEAYDHDRALARDYGQEPFSVPQPPRPAIEAEIRARRATLHGLETRRRALQYVLLHYGCRYRVHHHIPLHERCRRWFVEGNSVDRAGVAELRAIHILEGELR